MMLHDKFVVVGGSERHAHIAEAVQLFAGVPVMDRLYCAAEKTLCGIPTVYTWTLDEGNGFPVCRKCARIAQRRGWV